MHVIMNRRVPQQAAPQNVQAAVARARSSGRLNICNMQLSEIPVEVYGYYSSSKNRGNEINFDKLADGEQWWDKVDLTRMEASSNNIGSIDAAIAELPALSSIDLHDNKISSIAPELASLATVLKFLNLSRNELLLIPPTLFRLHGLQDLNLSQNSISDLQDAIGNLNELRSLLMNNNKLTQLPTDLGLLTKLTVLNISNNQLKQLPAETGNLLQLRQLFLSHNELTSLPIQLSYLMHLEILDASNNKLQTALWKLPLSESSSQNVNLHTILLSCNRITKITDDDVEALQMYPRLQTLDLGDNAINELSDKFYLLFHLARLNLTNNQVEELPNSLGLLPMLQHLLIDGNPLRRIRRDLIKRGTLAVKEFLRSRLPDVELQRMRLEMGEHVGGGENSSRSAAPQCFSAANNDAEKPFTQTKKENAPDTVESFFAARSGTDQRGKLLLSKTLLNLADDGLWKTAAVNNIFHVELSHNALISAPVGLSLLCRTLSELDLSNNFIAQLDIKSSFATLENLIYLNLSRNKLKTLFDDIPSTAVQDKVEQGDAENQNNNKNQNEAFPLILPLLRELDIGFNQFTSLPASFLRNKSKLEILTAGNNRIKTIDTACLRELPRLATLDLSNNEMDRLPPELALCKNINLLKVEGNSFRVPRYDVLSKGTQAVMEYLRSRLAV